MPGALFRDVGALLLVVAGAPFGDVGLSVFDVGVSPSWPGQYLVTLDCQFLMLDCHFSWQVECLVMLQRHFSWQARQQNLLGEAFQCMEQSPLAPIPRAVAKAKAAAATTSGLGVAGSGGTDGSLAGSVIGGIDSRRATCGNFAYKMHLQSAKSNLVEPAGAR